MRLLRETGHCVHNGVLLVCESTFQRPTLVGVHVCVGGSSTVAWLCGWQLLQCWPMVEVFVPACPLQRLQLRQVWLSTC